MKSKILMALSLIAFLFFSCKKEANKAEPNVKENFSVELEVSCAKSDDFALYYSEDGTSNFKDINAIWKGINGGGKEQKIIFDLAEDKIPTHIRLDFGLKSEQDSVRLKNVKINYYGNTIDVAGADFFKYFIKNEQFATQVDASNGTLIMLAKDGIYKTPYYYPTQLTIDKIKEITSTK